MARHKTTQFQIPDLPSPAALGANGFQSATRAYQTWIEGVTACNAEATRFLGKRLAKDFEATSQLAHCQTPTDVFELQSSFVQTMISDYADEAQRMTSLATEAFTNGLESGERKASKKKS